MLSRLLRDYLRPYRLAIAGVVALQLVQVVANLYLPSLMADIIDKGVAVGDTGYITSTGAVMLGITVVQIICSIGAVYLGAKLAMAFGRDLRAAVFRTVGSFSARELNSFGAASLITRNTNDIQQVQMLVVMGAIMLVSAPIMCVGGIVMAIKQDATLSWLLVVSVPVLVIAITLIVARMVPQFRLMQVKIDDINRVLREQIAGIRVVRAFVREPHETNRFSRANRDVTATALAAGRLQALMFPTVMLVVNASSVAVLWFGGRLISDGSMQVGSLTAFLSYLMQILMSVMMATFMAIFIPRASVCADRIIEVLDTPSTVLVPARPRQPAALSGRLEFRDVEFSYPGADHPVLRNLNFTMSPGQRTAIIGSTGAGKSTLLGLVPRLFDATGGALLLDGVDLRELDPELLRAQLGLVPQRPYLFSGTVASNLRYGKPDATEDELWEALEVAQAREFVAAMPDGLDTAIAQGGTTVSGGQRQRLAIARALVRRPKIYLFDDSFSALDLGTDARLRAALRPRTASATTVIVGQRISTIMDSDQIIVLDDGEVVGLGTHDELVAECPTYQEIVASQFTGVAA